MDLLLTFSGVQLAKLIRTKEITSRQAVETHIAHIHQANPRLNALVVDRFEEAIREADAADQRLASEPPESLPPFHGVPCSIKESFALTGMPNTSGLMARKGQICEGDAPTVARIRQAGAIPLGVTNLSELCMWMESVNMVYGRTNNAYNPEHIAGGSSGGEGSLIGAGGTPFGLGSDIGGSIRMPAFFNGVFGHKPSSGVVPCTGQYPIPFGEALRYIGTGPLARRAEDLMPVLRAIAGPDGQDESCRMTDLKDPETVNLGSLRVVNVLGNGFNKVSQELIDAQNKAASHLSSLGASVETRTIPNLKKSLEIWSSMLTTAGGHEFRFLLGHNHLGQTFWQLVRWSLRASPHTLPALLLVILERFGKLFPNRLSQFTEMGLKLQREIIELLGPQGILLYPSYPTVAPKHMKPLIPPFQWVYTAIFNVLELPVTQVPLGLNPQGLPLGVQVASIPGNDHVTIAVALELEKAFGGWVPPWKKGK